MCNHEQRTSTMEINIAEPKVQVIYHNGADVKRDIIQSGLMMVTLPSVSAIVGNAWSGEAGDPDSKVIGQRVRMHITLDPEEYDSLTLPEHMDEHGVAKTLNLNPSHNGFNGSRFVQITFSRALTDEEYDTLLKQQRDSDDVLAVIADMLAEEIVNEKG